MLTHSTLAALNHLLAQNGWALPRLAKFGGRTLRFKAAPFSLTCLIQPDGSLREAEQDAGVDAELMLPPSLLPRLALRDEAAFAQIESRGDAALAEEALFLARNLRWDAAEDISRITGDVAAERIVRFAAEGGRQARDAALNLSQALAEYWTEERPLLAQPAQIAEFTRDVSELRASLEKLEQRIRALPDQPR